MTSEDANSPGTNTQTKPRFFYGWVMLAVATLMAFATNPGQSILVSLFNSSYERDLAIPLSSDSGPSISLAYFLGTICGALPLAFVGRMADKHGIRIVTLIVSIAFTLALLLLSQVRAVPSTVTSHALLTFALLTTGFFLIRFLGQGCLGMLAEHTTAMWFERKLGTAHGILKAGGFALGGALLVWPVGLAIDHFGWRIALVMLAGMVFVLTVPAALFIFCNKPEDIGQHLDGDDHEHEVHDYAHGGPLPKDEPSFTWQETLRTRAFYILMFVSTWSGFVGTALLFHMTKMLKTAGIEGENAGSDAKKTALTFLAFPLAMAATNLFMGRVADKFTPQKILFIGPVLTAVSCAVCLFAVAGVEHFGIAENTPDHYARMVLLTMSAGMAIFGVSQAAGMAVAGPTLARYYGRANHGVIRSIKQTVGVAGTAAGPFVVGLIYTWTGEVYTWALLALTIACLPLTAATFTLKKPVQKEA